MRHPDSTAMRGPMSGTAARATLWLLLAAMMGPLGTAAMAAGGERPNFILCMADDQGWGDVAYNGHPRLKTPVLDEMAATALRFNRFYSAAPVCSPTRGSVMTGRHPNRFGCFSWGYPLRPQEVTIAEALKPAGYATGHFGKWHLGPVEALSPVSPGGSGFDEWLSSPNFFDLNPLLSRRGEAVRMQGEGSEITVDAALDFIGQAAARKQPFLAVVWFGNPHAPHQATDADRALYADQPEKLQHYYGEITAIDRAMGNLRAGLRRLGIAENTLLWYTSDNGATGPGSTGGLSGNKGGLLEGGIRVPAVIEWPARIASARVTELPCGTVDIYPTLLELAGTSVPQQVKPLDGISLVPLLDGPVERRQRPMGFWVYPAKGQAVKSEAVVQAMADAKRQKRAAGVAGQPAAAAQYGPDTYRTGKAAWIDNEYKLYRGGKLPGEPSYTLFNLVTDPQEKQDLSAAQPQRVARMAEQLDAWLKSVVGSLNGDDY